MVDGEFETQNLPNIYMIIRSPGRVKRKNAKKGEDGDEDED